MFKKISHKISFLPDRFRPRRNPYIRWFLTQGLAVILLCGALIYATRIMADETIMDMDGKPINPYQDVLKVADDDMKAGREKDEFQVLQERMATDRKKQVKPGPSDDEVVEQELKKIREAEEKVAVEERRQKDESEKVRRSQSRDQLQRDQNDETKFRNELRKDLENLPEVTKEDTSWNGLDD